MCRHFISNSCLVIISISTLLININLTDYDEWSLSKCIFASYTELHGVTRSYTELHGDKTEIQLEKLKSILKKPNYSARLFLIPNS